MIKEEIEIATCRGCGKALRGEPYYKGKPAFLENGRQAKTCHYGGFVCSYDCDYQATLELEESMPGHAGQKRLDPNFAARLSRKWSEND